MGVKVAWTANYVPINPLNQVLIICPPWFNSKGLCILLSQCIDVFHMIVAANSSYFPKHNSVGGLSNTEAMSVL